MLQEISNRDGNAIAVGGGGVVIVKTVKQYFYFSETAN